MKCFLDYIHLRINDAISEMYQLSKQWNFTVNMLSLAGNSVTPYRNFFIQIMGYIYLTVYHWSSLSLYTPNCNLSDLRIKPEYHQTTLFVRNGAARFLHYFLDCATEKNVPGLFGEEDVFTENTAGLVRKESYL